ncbi:MAG: extracellular solute-binding protein [Bacilli bacterium]|jgi:ABC-type glycerol-3-phosphate transport system substrate-binding protein|nr:extracellular solute-binding protein [Bacilli bacterium]
MKRNRFKYLAFGAFLALTFTLTTGCSKNGDGGGDGTIRFWVYQPSKPEDQTAYKNLMTEFKEETGISVQLLMIVKDSYNQAINSALSSRSKPDMAYLDQPKISDFADDGTLACLDDYIAESEVIDNSKFFQSGLATSIYKGKQYGVPLNMTTSVLFYNKNIVGEEAPKSWDEWLNTPIENSQHSLFDGIGTGGYAGWYYQDFLANNGGKLLNDAGTAVAFNDAKGVAAAKMIQDLYTFDKRQASQNRSSNNAFGRGQIAYKLGSSSDIDALDTNFPTLNYGIAKIPPSVAGQTSYSNMGGENLVVFDHSPNKKNCIKLIEFLLRKENINRIASFTGNFPAIEEYASVDSIPVVREESRARKAVILDQLSTSVPRPVIPK